MRKRLEKEVPEGKIRVDNRNGSACYYLKSNMKKNAEELNSLKNGKYLRKDELGVAKQIIQRDYDQMVARQAEERIKAINTFLKRYKKTNIEQIYEKTNIGRRKLLETAILSDEEYIKWWSSISYKGKGFDDEIKEIYTDRGERVRSKSEKIIADKLNIRGVPYKYECPLQLKDGIVLYPDFTLLNIDTREEIYLEHCGLMDNQGYVDTLMYKLRTYERNGIYLGVNLFITYESEKFPFNTKVLDELIKYLFGCMNDSSLIK